MQSNRIVNLCLLESLKESSIGAEWLERISCLGDHNYLHIPFAFPMCSDTPVGRGSARLVYKETTPSHMNISV